MLDYTILFANFWTLNRSVFFLCTSIKKVWLALYRALYKAVKAAGSNSFLIGHFVHKLSLCSKKGHLVCLLIQD